MLFRSALDAAEQMAQIVGDTNSAAWMHGLAENIRGNFVSHFYDETRGVFGDARINGKLSKSISEHANFAALRWGCCPKELANRIIKNFYEFHTLPDAIECQPFFMVVVLEALRKYGHTDLALNLIRERWGKRMLAAGATSCFESWTVNGSVQIGRAWCRERV